MKRALGIAVWFALALVTATQKVEAAPLHITLREHYSFSVQMGAGFSIAKQEGADFDVYTLAVAAEEYLRIYVGNHPNYPDYQTKDEEFSELDLCTHPLSLEEIFLSRSGQSVSDLKIGSWRRNGKLVHKELLAYIRTDREQIPLYIHARISSSLSEEKVQVADQILSTLKISVDRRD